jgi:hypothetical protein
LVSVFRSFAHHPSPESHMPLVVRVMHVLYRGAQVDLTRVIDVVSLQHMGERLKVALACGDQRAQASGWDEIRTKPDLGPQSLVPWLIAIGPEALARVVPILERGEDGNAATNLAFGFRAAIEQWLGTKGCHSANFLEGGPDLAHATRQVLNHLFARWKPDTADVPPALRRIWMWFGWCTCDADLDAWRSNPPDSAGPLLHAATADAAAARKILARAGQADEQPGAESPAALELQAELDHLRVCVYLLFFLGGVWPALKVMVLWLRSSTVPAVARDLRHWHEHGLEAPPEPWSALVAWPTNLFHVFVGDEQRSDHELVALRGQFASFCLERLVDRWKQSQREAAEQSGQQRTDEDMLERSPEWRYCYVRAVSSLGINPEGKGHRVLHKASQIDPDPDVREAARQGYERMRRGVGLPEDTSPRRAIMSALWWIRQAHLLGLGIQPDPDGAQRTRIKELSRTKEAERYDPTASRQPTE